MQSARRQWLYLVAFCLVPVLGLGSLSLLLVALLMVLALSVYSLHANRQFRWLGTLFAGLAVWTLVTRTAAEYALTLWADHPFTKGFSPTSTVCLVSALLLYGGLSAIALYWTREPGWRPGDKAQAYACALVSVAVACCVPWSGRFLYAEMMSGLSATEVAGVCERVRERVRPPASGIPSSGTQLSGIVVVMPRDLARVPTSGESWCLAGWIYDDGFARTPTDVITVIRLTKCDDSQPSHPAAMKMDIIAWRERKCIASLSFRADNWGAVWCGWHAWLNGRARLRDLAGQTRGGLATGLPRVEEASAAPSSGPPASS